MCVKMTQHPVGQGGLFYGVLRHVNGEHKWMYDCGSFDSKELHREIDLISDLCNHKINEFYLSHFHVDHKNGFDYLTNVNRVKVDDVIIPYLDVYEKIATLAEHKINGYEVNAEIVEFVMTPEKFFFERRVDRVIIVRRGYDSDDTGSSPISPEPERPKSPEGAKKDRRRFSEDKQLAKIWKPEPTEVVQSIDSTKKLLEAESEAIAELNISNAIPGYKFVFVTHARLISKDEIFQLKIEIDNLKNQYKVKDVKDIIGKPNWLDEIERCYKCVWPTSKQNSISMSLYIGPQKDQSYNGWLHVVNVSCVLDKVYVRVGNFLHRVIRGFPYWLHWRYRVRQHEIKSLKLSECGGWLLTGDSILDNTKNYRDQFERRYQDYMPYVNVLMVPHHGSKNNVSREFFDFFKNLDVCYVSSNPSKYSRHPDSDVENMVPKSILFHKVDTSSESILEVNCDVYDFW